MGSPFAVGKKAFGFCDRCGFRYLLVDLRVEVVALQDTSIKVCPECFDPDQPQLQLGRYEFNDPQALRNPRPDTAQSASRFGVSIRYDFEEDTDYFKSKSGSLGWQTNQSIRLTGNNVNPGLVRDGATAGSANVDVDSSVYNKVRVRLKMISRPSPLSAWEGAFQWYRLEDSPAFISARTVYASAPDWNAMGNQSHVITWDLREVSLWSSTVIGVRFDFFDFQSESSYTNGTLEIDYVRFESDDEQT